MIQFPSPLRLSLFGLLLSMYAVYVEHKTAQEGDDFVALCDISAIGASCRQVLES